MKKRFLTLLLVLLTVLSLGLEAYAAAAPAHIEDYNIVTENKALGTGTPSASTLFSTAFVRNANISDSKPNGDPKKLDVVVNMKNSDRAYLCAIVMSAADYAARYPNGPADPQGNITAANYWNLGFTLTSATYAIGRRTGTSTLDQQVSLRLVAPSSANVSALDAGNTVAYKDLQVAGIDGDNYYREYVLIVFGQNAEGSDKASSYYIDRFYLDAAGYVATPSYGVRYVCDNNVFAPLALETYSITSIPSGNAGSQVDLFRAAWTNDRAAAAGTKPDPEKSTLTESKPARTGVRFIGWTTEQRPVLAADDTPPTSHETDKGFYAPGEVYDEPDQMYKVYNLYALWQEVPVKFNHTVEDATTKLITFDQTPQVGVAFNASGNSSNYTQNPGGNKRFQVKVYEAESLDITNPDPSKLQTGTIVNGAAGKPSNADAAARWLSDAGTSVTTRYGLIVRRTNGTDNNNWQIIGTPSDYSAAGNHVWFCITVQDSSCGTTDTVWVYFDQIKKGAQPIPTLDDNTGLQSRVEKKETTDDSGSTIQVDDGQLYGFYSAGPTIETDEDLTGYKPVTGDVTTGTNGVNGAASPGTMTGYYLNLGMVYEYRPIKVGGTAVDYTDTELPNDGWREVPFPQGWYNEEELALLMPSLGKNAQTLTYSTRQGNNNAEIQAQTPPEGFAGWPDSYGYIAFDETSELPIVHGLTADDVYEVRFRANAIYEVSEARELTIGGAVGSGGGTASGGLAVNLAGGRVINDPDTVMDETNIYRKFVTDCKALQIGGSVDIPDITPTRENYTFAGWTLGELDENGLLILYKYPGETDGSEGGEGSGDSGNEGDPGQETPEQPLVTYRSSVTLTEAPMALAAVWESTPYAITFYDWDGRVIDAIGAPKDATAAVAAWQAKDWVTQRLTKPGYDFDNWIVVYEDNDGEGLHAKAGSLTSRKSEGEDGKLSSTDIADFGDLEQMTKEDSKSVLVQAVYVANETVNDSLGEDANLNLPTTQYELDDNPTYYQYGPATSEVATYGITFTIKRNSMLRTDQPTIQARIYSNPTGTKSDIVTVRLDLENTDETTFEVFVPKSATQVDVVLRDTYGKVDWTNAQPRSTRITIEKATFVYEGAMATIIDEAWQVANGTGSWNAVDRQCFLDANCGTVTDDQIGDVLNRLVAATNANGGKKLTAEQVQAAVKGS